MTDESKPASNSKECKQNIGVYKKNYMNDNNNNRDFINPFVNNILNELTFAQKLQIAIMSFTIAPLRLILLLITFSILWPLGSLMNYGRTEEDKKKPIEGWRKSLYPLARLVSRTVFFLAGFHWLKITGTPDMNVPIMVFAPHSGFFDSMLVVYLNFVTVIGRAGSDKVPLFGNLTKLCQPIIVDREKQTSRTDSVKQLIERATSKLDWPPVSIYAEGTCTNRKALAKFKAGAFIPGVPIQPVCIRYSTNVMDTVTWSWEGPNSYKLVWLSLCQIHIPVEFSFLPVYNPSDEEKKNAELYGENVRKVMADYLNIPLSEFAYEDGKLLVLVKEHNIPWKFGTINVLDLKKKYRINVEKIYDLVPYYAKFADKSTGICYLDSFAKNLGVKLSTPVIKLFELFDTEKCGNFSLGRFFHVYCESIHANINESNLNERIQNAIKLFENFSSNESNYTTEDFKNEAKSKFDIEFENFDLLELDETNIISRDKLENFFRRNVLFLYLVFDKSKA